MMICLKRLVAWNDFFPVKLLFKDRLAYIIYC